jgi:6-phosphogluconolactonase (cycloisomerase 2 family)
METFSINLSNGSISQINNVNGPPITGLPSSVIIDPAGAYAYVATTVNCTPTNLPPNTSLSAAVQGAILAFQIASDGKLAASNAPVYLTGNSAYPGNFPTCGLDDSTNPNAGNPIAAMTMDSKGQFLFVAIAPAGAIYTINTNTANPTSTTATLNSPGVAVFAIGANATLTQVAGSPFALPTQEAGQVPTPSALAVTPTAFPAQYAVCTNVTPPTTEDLYVADAIDDVLVNFAVSSSGTLSLVQTGRNPIPTGAIPSGVAVDPCNRFVYVANAGPGTGANSVSAFTICSTVIAQTCPFADYSLLPVAGSPYPAGSFPGPIAVDAYGKFVYVVDTGSNEISGFRLSSATGALSALSPAVTATGQGPDSIAIRSDDSWVFVANLNSMDVSQYAITPASGTLTPTPPITTLNYPSGVAVK